MSLRGSSASEPTVVSVSRGNTSNHGTEPGRKYLIMGFLMMTSQSAPLSQEQRQALTHWKHQDDQHSPWQRLGAHTGNFSYLRSSLQHNDLGVELRSIHPAVTEIQTCLSPGKSPAAQRCTACLETSAAILRNEHREHAKNFKSSINSNRNGEDERKEDSASRKRNRWLLWSKKYNRKKWSSRTLFEGVKRQGGSLEKAKPRSWELNGGH